jgi:TldD protein
MTEALVTDRFSGLLESLAEHLRRRRAYGIFRLQSHRSRSVALEGSRVESVGAACALGLGVQAFTEEGHTGFSAVDDPDEARALLAADRAITAARAAEEAGLDANASVLGCEKEVGRAIPPIAHPFEHLDVGRMKDVAREFGAEAADAAGEVHASTSFGIHRDEWRIARTDGTDVSFVIPRSSLRVGLTARRGAEASRAHATDCGISYELLIDPGRRGRMLDRVGRGSELARELLDASAFPPGSYRLLIDFALAKGLAHEAFGHAAESDGLDSSILGREGRFRQGERFGAERVSIVDESVEGDNAYQPYSGNGVPRSRAVILSRGVLRDALSDVHTASRAGTRLTGAGRLTSFSVVPLPRMSNIRIEVEDPYPVPEGRDFYDWDPMAVRDLLVESGDLEEGERIVYLSGYRGGQVNPALGDFVFHSTALFELRTDGVRLYKPGIFSGRIEAALHSIVRGFGPLRLDAAGTCGKSGQGVPSSGGSHHFLLLEEHPEVRIGGRS